MEFELLSGTSHTTTSNQLLCWCQEGPRTQTICSWSSSRGSGEMRGFGAEVFHSLDGNANITKGRRNRGPPSQMEQILPQVTWKLKPETCVSPFS